jgi:hypothetical protein
MASHAAGVLGNLSTKLEGNRPGVLAGAADALPGAAQFPRHMGHEQPGTATSLRGAAAVAAQAVLPGGPAAWLGLVSEMRRLTGAVLRAHAPRDGAAAATAQVADAQRQLEAVHARYLALAAGQPDSRLTFVAGHIQGTSKKAPSASPGFGR